MEALLENPFLSASKHKSVVIQGVTMRFSLACQDRTIF